MEKPTIPLGGGCLLAFPKDPGEDRYFERRRLKKEEREGESSRRDEGTAIENGAGSASDPIEDADMAAPDVSENDLRRFNMCAEPFVKRRARRQEHVLRKHPNASLMNLHVHDMPATLFWEEGLGRRCATA